MAAKSSLTFDIFGRDRTASKALKGVGATADKTHKRLGVMGVGAGVMLGNIATAAAAAGVSFASDFVGKAISGATDINETVSKVGVLFGKQAGAIEKFAEGAGSALGQTKQQAMDAAATFATFGKSAGLSGGKLTGFSTQMTTLSSDLASFNNTSPEEAIEAIGAALRGESEPIRKYGVLLNDATLKARAMKLGLIKTTKEALTPQQKVLAAQAEIMAQTTAAQGDFQRTSGGLANQQRILSAEFENATTSAGQALMPMLTNLAKFATGTLIPAVKSLASWIGTNLGPIIEQLGGWIQTTALPAIKNLAAAFMENVWPAIQQVAAMIAENLQPVIEALAKFWRDTLQPGIARLVPVLATVAKVLGIVIGALALAVSWIVGKVAPVFYGILGPAINFIIGVLEKVTGAIEWVIDNFDEMVTFVRTLPARILGALGNLGSLLYNKGREIIQGLLDGAGSLLKNIGNFFLSKLPSWIVEPFKRALGIASPSKVFAELGVNISEGLLSGVAKGQPKAIAKIREMTQAAVDAARERLADLRSARQDMIAGIKDNLVGGMGLRDAAFDENGNVRSGGDIASSFQGYAARLRLFAQKLKALAKMGLAPILLQEVASLGSAEGTQVADALLSSGKGTIGTLNAASADIGRYAGQAGRVVGDATYSADIAKAKQVYNYVTRVDVKADAIVGANAARELVALIEQGIKSGQVRTNVLATR